MYNLTFKKWLQWGTIEQGDWKWTIDHYCIIIYEHTMLVAGSSVASPICQEGQSERNFPSFAFSFRFFLFFPYFPWIFPDFFLIFPDFWQYFCCQGWHSAPLATPVATPLVAGVFLLKELKTCLKMFQIRTKMIFSPNIWAYIKLNTILMRFLNKIVL